MLQPTPNARTIQLPQAHGGLQCVAFEVNMIQVNCYLPWDATREAVLVDGGAFYPEERAYIDAFIAEHDLRLVHLLITHGHFDHIFGLDHLSSRYNLLPEMGRNERATYEAAKEQMTAFLHRAFPLEVPPAGRMLDEGDEVCHIAVPEFAAELVYSPTIGETLSRTISRAVLDEDGNVIGSVTTGYRSITLNRNLAMALVNIGKSKLGTPVSVRVRRKTFPATVVKKRFYTPNYKK